MTVEVAPKILKQVEFYFGDANLPRDKFLLERVQENEGGWVTVETLASFSRMKNLTTDIEVIKAALSEESEVIELNDDKTLVRRKSPLPESRETLNRTLFVKGLPQDATLDQVQEFFAQHSDAVEAIRFRRHPKDRAFKGSVFAEFKSEEEANKFAALTLTFNGASVTIKSKMAYFEEKNAEKSGKTNGKAAALLEKMGTGRLLKINDFPKEGVTHEALKEALKDSFPVAYVDFSYEPGCAIIRFRESVAAKFVEEHAEKALEIGEFKFTSFDNMPEQEEAKYYEASMKPRKNDGKRGNNKRSARSFADEPSAKAAKEDVSA